MKEKPHPLKGRKLSEEHKQKIGIANSNPSEETRLKRSISMTGHKHTKESCEKMSKSHTGVKIGPHSEETKQKMSKAHTGKIMSAEARRNMSIAQQNMSEETKQKISRAGIGKHRGKDNGMWRGGVSESQYCEKFNEYLKEEIRDKYHRRCFECDKTEEENGRKLDVHHIDFNKEQGCDNHKWKLIPLCISCHSKTNGSNESRKQAEYHYRVMLEVCG